MSRKKKIPDYMKPSKVTTRKMTVVEREETDKLALQGFKNTYSKYSVNIAYGKNHMTYIKERIDELEHTQSKSIL